MYERDQLGVARIVTDARLEVRRIGGANRYATNRLVNAFAVTQEGGPPGELTARVGEPPLRSAVVARGDICPDALAAGVLTSGRRSGDGGAFDAKNALPLILTPPDHLVADASGQIRSLRIRHALLVGGTAALGVGGQSALDGLDVSMVRLGGTESGVDDRYSTAVAASEFAARSSIASPENPEPGLGFAGGSNGLPRVSATYLATGLDFADAVVGAAHVGRSRGLLLFTVGASRLGEANEAYLRASGPMLGKIIALGGVAAVSDSVLARANQLASGN